jgi:Nuclease-related domain
MAWQKLRSRKSPGRQVTLSSHSGAASDGAGSRGAAPDSATSARGPGEPTAGTSATGTPSSGTPSADTRGAGIPAVWPGVGAVPVQSTAAAPEASDEAEEPDESPSFLDWAPAEDPVDLDDLQDPDAARDDVVASSWQAATAADPPKPTWKLVVAPAEPAGEPPRQPGIGQRRGNLAHLSANPRIRAWQRRALIAIVVGVVFAVVVSWRLGLTLAVVAAIADTIYQSRRLPGRRVKMTRAQRHTRRQLAKLGRAGYHAMHGNLIPDSEEQIDHLVVGPAGVFAIDSESWDKHLVVRTKNARQLWHGPYSMKERLEHARWESERAAELLSGAVGSPVTVRPAMAVYGPRIPWDVATIREVDVFSGPRLRKYLRRRARQEGQRPLDDAEVERIYRAANEAFPHLTAGAPAR